MSYIIFQFLCTTYKFLWGVYWKHNYSVCAASLWQWSASAARNGCVLFVPFAHDCQGHAAHISINSWSCL